MIPAEAVIAARAVVASTSYAGSVTYRDLRTIFDASAPYLLAAKVAEAKANNDHIVPGGDGYSAGFHYALHCVEGDADDS